MRLSPFGPLSAPFRPPFGPSAGLDGVFRANQMSREGRMKRTCVAAVMPGVLSLLLACRDPYSVISIASEVTISKDWIELRLARPLRWSRPEEELSFNIDTPHSVGEGLEIIGPRGEHFVPEVEAIGENGNVFTMDSHGFLGEELVFSFKNKPSGLNTIQAVRLRSSTPLRVSNLRWRGYDPQEVKR